MRRDTWTSPREALGVASRREHLVQTVAVALVVGTALFLINQLDVVMAGEATAVTWVKAAATYVVPFLVANYGLLVATHRGGRASAPRP